LRINQKKFVDLYNSEICGFAMADRAREFADLRFAELKKTFAPTFDF
jgi:hypothetical protein